MIASCGHVGDQPIFREDVYVLGMHLARDDQANALDDLPLTVILQRPDGKEERYPDEAGAEGPNKLPRMVGMDLEECARAPGTLLKKLYEEAGMRRDVPLPLMLRTRSGWA